MFDFHRRIYLDDTDAAGVVYFAKGLEICHQAYEESLTEAGISLNQIIQEGTYALPIVHAEISFLRPLFCGDNVRVSLNTSLINSSEFAIAYQISPIDHGDRCLDDGAVAPSSAKQTGKALPSVSLAPDGERRECASVPKELCPDRGCGSHRILVKASTRHVCINPRIRQRIDLPPQVLNWLHFCQSPPELGDLGGD